MPRLRIAAFLLFALVSVLGSRERVSAYHNGYQNLLRNNCTDVTWGYDTHPHLCDGVANAQACDAWCNELGWIESYCTNTGPNTSDGYCRCNPVTCCELNDCASGDGGAEWGPEHCGQPDTDQGPDACGCCTQNSCPILISLRNNDVHLSGAADGVRFDFWGDGRSQLLAWPTTPDDAWLALDRNHNGQIDDGTELFGNAVEISPGQHAPDGYEVLHSLDANGDGEINALDPAFADLLLWQDTTRNGVTDPGELISLTAAGIEGIGVDHAESRRVDQWGNSFRYRGRVRTGGGNRFSVDVFLATQE